MAIVICDCDGSCWKFGKCKSQDLRLFLKKKKKDEQNIEKETKNGDN